MERLWQSHCPWLGSHEDSTTHYAFPTVENLCGVPNGPVPLGLAQQEHLCLYNEYSTCPFYVPPDSIEPGLAQRAPMQTQRSAAARGSKVIIAALGALAAGLAISTIAVLFFRTPIAQMGWLSRPTPTFILFPSPSLVSPTAFPPAASVPFPPVVLLTSPSLSEAPSVPSQTPSPTSAGVASPSPSPSLSATPTPITYVVVRGDTLTRIASHYGVTVATLVAANNLKDPRVIYPGTVLVIPIRPGFEPNRTETPTLQPALSTPTPRATP